MRIKSILNVTALLILLFGIAHTAGYPWIGPLTQAQQLVLSNAFKATAVVIQGFARSYEDSHIGFGYFISLFFVTQAGVVWRLSSHAEESPGFVRLLCVAFAAQYLVSVMIETRYLFWGPIAFSLLIAAGFIAGALKLRTARRAPATVEGSEAS